MIAGSPRPIGQHAVDQAQKSAEADARNGGEPGIDPACHH